MSNLFLHFVDGEEEEVDFLDNNDDEEVGFYDYPYDEFDNCSEFQWKEMSYYRYPQKTNFWDCSTKKKG